MLETLLRTLNRKATSWRLLVLALKANTVHKHSRFRPEVVVTVSRYTTKQLARLEEKNPMAMKEAVSTCGAYSGQTGNELHTNAVGHARSVTRCLSKVSNMENRDTKSRHSVTLQIKQDRFCQYLGRHWACSVLRDFRFANPSDLEAQEELIAGRTRFQDRRAHLRLRHAQIPRGLKPMRTYEWRIECRIKKLSLCLSTSQQSPIIMDGDMFSVPTVQMIDSC